MTSNPKHLGQLIFVLVTPLEFRFENIFLKFLDHFRLFFFTENGLLSYENPNYHLDPARLDDALNSNTDEDLYEDIYNELDALKLSGNGSINKLTSSGGQTRRNYANLDIGSMGVDITGPVLDSNTFTDNRR